jgi:RNA polymerase-binding transcription factor DksA
VSGAEAERGGDIIDKAARASETFLAASLSQCRAESGPEQHPDFDGSSCVDCGCDIPAGRLALGKVRCVPCKDKRERAHKLMRG